MGSRVRFMWNSGAGRFASTTRMTGDGAHQLAVPGTRVDGRTGYGSPNVLERAIAGQKARLSYYDKKGGINDQVRVRLQALDVDWLLLDEYDSGDYVPAAGAWNLQLPTQFTLPYLEGQQEPMALAVAAGGDSACGLDEIDVFVGDVAEGNAAFTNLNLDSLTGWTQSGTWAVESSAHLVGTGCAKCTSAGEIYQQQTLSSASDDEGDMVWVSGWFYQAHADDQLSLVAELRDSGGSIIASATIPSRSPAFVGQWLRRELELEIPSGAAGGSLRIRGVVAALGSGSAGAMLDSLQCVVVKATA